MTDNQKAMPAPRYFPCTCHYAQHALHVDMWQEEWSDYTVIATVLNAPGDLSLRQRLKAAWDVLRGREHLLSEVILDGTQADALIEHLIAGRIEQRIAWDGETDV